MQLFSRACVGVEPSPRWLVSNGELTVGPVDTDRLLRGVASGKIPLDCQVSLTGESWRPVVEVREVRRARMGTNGPTEPIPGSIRHSIQWLADARNVAEAYSLALHGACIVTGAQAGVLYRYRSTIEPLLVCATFGNPPLTRGAPVSRTDAAWYAAQEGEPSVFNPEATPAGRVMTDRLSSAAGSVRGLALVPLRGTTDIIGVIELARFDHPFRATDARALVPLVTASVARIEELSCEPSRP